MIQEISRQAAEFFWAGALGIGLGVSYDVGRSLRRLRRGLTVTVDVLFAVLFFLSLWLTSVYTHGLRAYQCLGIFLGGSVYFLTLSPVLLRVFGWLFRKAGRLGRLLTLPLKKFVNFLRKVIKKCFPSSGKWGTINAMPFSPSRQKTKEARNHHEAKTREKSRRQDSDGAAGRVRRHRDVRFRRRAGQDHEAAAKAGSEPAGDRV